MARWLKKVPEVISEVEGAAMEVWEEKGMETLWDVNRLTYATATLVTKELKPEKEAKGDEEPEERDEENEGRRAGQREMAGTAWRAHGARRRGKEPGTPEQKG